MLEVYGVALISVIVGLVEVLKRAGLPKRFLPLASLLIGIATSILYIYPTDIRGGIIVGIMIGLSASGLYSSTKNTMEKKNKSEDE